jgi:hypothetical protein
MHIEQAQELLSAAAIMLGFVGAVLVLALADVGLTLLLLRWASKIKDLARTEPNLPELPPDHKVVVIGGGIRKW